MAETPLGKGMKVGPDCPGLTWATEQILLYTNKPVGRALLKALLLLKTPIRTWKFP